MNGFVIKFYCGLLFETLDSFVTNSNIRDTVVSFVTNRIKTVCLISI